MRYLAGDEARVGDIVLVCGRRRATTKEVIRSGSDAAREWGVDCDGIMIAFDDGDPNWQFWPNLDEDIELVGRATAG